jgi:hypothetical protein
MDAGDRKEVLAPKRWRAARSSDLGDGRVRGFLAEDYPNKRFQDDLEAEIRRRRATSLSRHKGQHFKAQAVIDVGFFKEGDWIEVGRSGVRARVTSTKLSFVYYTTDIDGLKLKGHASALHKLFVPE